MRVSYVEICVRVVSVYRDVDLEIQEIDRD